MAKQKKPQACIGFGEFTGKCSNPAGSTHSAHWCQRCDILRRAHITQQLESLLAEMPAASRPATGEVGA